MKSYSETFTILKERKRTALVPFFVAGDPEPEVSLEIVRGALEAGADILELGVPFSDPIADGPTIQKADLRASRAGMTVAGAIDFIKRVRGMTDVPIGLLMYYNLVYQYGVSRFMQEVRSAGANSVLVADLSIDDAAETAGPAREAGLDTVFMATPNTPDERIRLIASHTTGFIYTVSLLGVTGSRGRLSGEAGGLVARIKAISELPVCVGFGISRPEHAAAVASAGADGVIIGSRLVQIIEENLDVPAAVPGKVKHFLQEVRQAMDGKKAR